MDDVTQKPLIVKITPIQYENMQNRKEWLVICNREIKDEDLKNPFGPQVISGSNMQLTAANYYYGLPDENINKTDRWIYEMSKWIVDVD